MSANGLGNMELWSAGLVQFAAGAPSLTWVEGPNTGTVTDTGVGDVSLNMPAGNGIDATECQIDIMPYGAVANWPRPVATSVVHTSDVAKQILLAQEGAAAGAFAAVDQDFTFKIWRRKRI